MDPRDGIRGEAERLGFVRCRFAAAGPPAHVDAFDRWLAAGHAGEMAYMREQAAPRRDATRLLADARTVVSVVASYAAPDPSPDDHEGAAGGPRGSVARYARGADYHVEVGRRLRALAAFVRRETGGDARVRTCVDALPLLERDFAEAAGAGFCGKNTMLITPGVGSYTVLGELLADVALAPDESERPRCGDCRACLDACPTGAIVADHVVDARRCISYLTIELHGPIPRDLRAAVGTMIFGCDVCQEVCPHNRGARVAGPPEIAPRPGRGAPALIPLLSLAGRRYRRFVAGTALRRVRRSQFLRNVCVALGNAGDARAAPALSAALADREPLVRGHAAWALGRLGAGAPLRAALPAEADPRVRDEIEWALGGV